MIKKYLKKLREIDFDDFKHRLEMFEISFFNIAEPAIYIVGLIIAGGFLLLLLTALFLSAFGIEI